MSAHPLPCAGCDAVPKQVARWKAMLLTARAREQVNLVEGVIEEMEETIQQMEKGC